MKKVIITYKMPEKEFESKVYKDNILDVISVHKQDDFFIIDHCCGTDYYNCSDIIKIEFLK